MLVFGIVKSLPSGASSWEAGRSLFTLIKTNLKLSNLCFLLEKAAEDVLMLILAHHL